MWLKKSVPFPGDLVGLLRVSLILSTILFSATVPRLSSSSPTTGFTILISVFNLLNSPVSGDSGSWGREGRPITGKFGGPIPASCVHAVGRVHGEDTKPHPPKRKYYINVAFYHLADLRTPPQCTTATVSSLEQLTKHLPELFFPGSQKVG